MESLISFRENKIEGNVESIIYQFESFSKNLDRFSRRNEAKERVKGPSQF